MTTLLAPVMLSPVPPAAVEIRNRKAEARWLKRSTIGWRSCGPEGGRGDRAEQAVQEKWKDAGENQLRETPNDSQGTPAPPPAPATPRSLLAHPFSFLEPSSCSKS